MYVNMFTTVMKTYIYILLSYLAFLLSFAYSFFLIYGAQVKMESIFPYFLNKEAELVSGCLPWIS